VRDLFRETETREREKRKGFAKMVGVFAGMIALVICVAVEVWLRLLTRRSLMLTIVVPFVMAAAVAGFLEKKLERRIFPWLDDL
jgi:hypothetical protein